MAIVIAQPYQRYWLTYTPLDILQQILVTFFTVAPIASNGVFTYRLDGIARIVFAFIEVWNTDKQIFVWLCI